MTEKQDSPNFLPPNLERNVDMEVELNVQEELGEPKDIIFTCGNCKGLLEKDGIRFYDPSGHETKNCTRNASSDGFIHACPGHNTREHDPFWEAERSDEELTAKTLPVGWDSPDLPPPPTPHINTRWGPVAGTQEDTTMKDIGASNPPKTQGPAVTNVLQSSNRGKGALSSTASHLQHSSTKAAPGFEPSHRLGKRKRSPSYASARVRKARSSPPKEIELSDLDSNVQFRHTDLVSMPEIAVLSRRNVVDLHIVDSISMRVVMIIVE
jgi:hypothetical protein